MNSPMTPHLTNPAEHSVCRGCLQAIERIPQGVADPWRRPADGRWRGMQGDRDVWCDPGEIWPVQHWPGDVHTDPGRVDREHPFYTVGRDALRAQCAAEGHPSMTWPGIAGALVECSRCDLTGEELLRSAGFIRLPDGSWYRNQTP